MTLGRVHLTTFRRKQLTAILAFTALGSIGVQEATAQVRQANGLTVLTTRNGGNGGRQEAVDFITAKPMQLPVTNLPADPTQFLISAMTSGPLPGTPGYSKGAEGTGTTAAEFLGTPVLESGPGIAPQMVGTNNHPFTTARADLSAGGATSTNTAYPYRAAGKLFFNIGGVTHICSASLIKRGLVVTAAHCVANYGQRQFYSGWQFVPGYRNGSAPFGTATVAQIWVPTAYYNGTDGCYQYGVICPDDVAILTLNTNNGAYVGTATGWFSYGWDGYGYVNNQTQITQLGYPGGLDSAAYMERNDSSGFTNTTYSNDTMIGSNMDGGSSGGPWLVNFGIAPTLTGETNGGAPSPNVVVGVTSWGFASTAAKEQGASRFTSNNIVSLVNTACGAAPAACQ